MDTYKSSGKVFLSKLKVVAGSIIKLVVRRQRHNICVAISPSTSLHFNSHEVNDIRPRLAEGYGKSAELYTRMQVEMITPLKEETLG